MLYISSTVPRRRMLITTVPTPIFVPQKQMPGQATVPRPVRVPQKMPVAQPMPVAAPVPAPAPFLQIFAISQPMTVLAASNGLKFQVDYSKVLGMGGFGKIYLGKNLATGVNVAVKIVPKNNSSNNSYLLNEIKMYNKLKGGIGIPKIYLTGSNNANDYLVMELLGPSLQQIFDTHNKKFDISQIVSIGVKILNILDYIHNKNIIHGDIKPSCFLQSNYTPFEFFIIDFGFSREINPLTGLSKIEGIQFIGDPKFASKNAFQGIAKGKKDDIESLGYMLIYFLRGFLPWEDSQNLYLVKQKKLSISLDDLCYSLAPQMKEFMTYTYNLGNKDKPNYNYLRQLLLNYKNIVYLSPVPAVQAVQTVQTVQTFPAVQAVQAIPVRTFFTPVVQPLIQFPVPQNIIIPAPIPAPVSPPICQDEKNKENFKQLNDKQFDQVSNISIPACNEDLKIIERDYIGTPNSFKINEILRKIGPNGLDFEQLELYNALTRAINNNRAEENYKVHRYVDNDYLRDVFNFIPLDIFYNLAMIRQQIGSIKVEKGFMSCFMTEKHFIERSVLLEINIPKGTRAYITRNAKESEIILPCNTYYKIMDAKINCNKIQIDVLILNDNNDEVDLFSSLRMSDY